MTAKPNATGARRKGPKGTGNSKRPAAGRRTRRLAAGKEASVRSKPRREKTANDLMMEAWEYTYKTRDRRLTKP
jgi:hypothetical protein